MKYLTCVAFLFSLFIVAPPAMATIIGQEGGIAITPTATEDFETISFLGDDLWVGSSITVRNLEIDRAFFWGATTNFTTNALYQNGGAHGPISISLNSGADISAIHFDVSNGWSDHRGQSVTPQNIWVRTLFDGIFTGFEFDFNLPNNPDTISILSAGTLFDEVQLFAYLTPAVRDSHVFTAQSAASIDNIVIGTGTQTVPSPPVVFLFGIGLAALGWARRENVC